MVQREVFKPIINTMAEYPDISFYKNEISEMCSFVEASRQEENNSSCQEKIFIQKRLEYNKLKRRKSDKEKQKLVYLNNLLKLNGCFNDYANHTAAKGNYGILKNATDNAVWAFSDFFQNGIKSDLSDDALEGLLNCFVSKAIDNIGINERILKNFIIFVKVFHREQCLSNNHIDRFFYESNKYDNKKTLYFIPIIKGNKTEYETIRDEIIEIFMHQLEPMMQMRIKKQTIFCHPVWIVQNSSRQIIKKVW